MIKRFILVGLLLLLVCGGLVGFNMFRAQAIEEFFATMQRPPVQVTATTAEAVTWRPSIETFGTAAAFRGVDVAAETSGIVADILFEANDTVASGQLLVQLNDAVERAELIAAEAAVERDRLAYERANTLTERGAGTTANRDTAESAYAASRSQLARLEAVLDQKAITAPFDGTIGIPRVDWGQYVTAGTVIATLQDLTHIHVDFSVPEQTASLLSIGQPVRADGGAAGVFEGGITGIDPRSDAASRMVWVRARVDNTDGRLRPGQFLRVDVLMPEEPGIVAVPQTAVVSSLYGDYVYRIDGGGEGGLIVRQVFVSTGRSSGGQVEIVSGLAAGDRVVAVGQNRLASGAPVVIATGSAPPLVAAAD